MFYAVLAVAGHLGPATVSASDEPRLRFDDQTAVAWVLVPVVVRSPRGFVRDLEAKHFELLVDGVPTPFESFDHGLDAPLSLIHLQDLSGSMAGAGKLESGQSLVRCLLGKGHPGDEYALASFAAGRTTVDVPFTNDQQVHDEAVSLWRAYGSTALHDAIAWLPEIGLAGRNVRRAAVLVTDGTDNASVMNPLVAREAVRHAKLPVYVVAVGDGARRRQAKRPPNTQRAVLQLLAQRTGGRYYALAEHEAQDVCQGIDNELRHQYVLGFRTRAASDNRDRRLDVTVRAGKNVNVLHREGYHGGAP